MMRAQQIPQKAENSARFREISELISKFANEFGVEILPYRDESLVHFQKLSLEKQKFVLKALAHQSDFFAMAQAEKLHPNSPKLIWRMLSKMGMVPQTDIFDKITEEDTVEVYHGDGNSSFKNLKFFEFVSHSLEEVFCIPVWKQLSVSPQIYLFFLEIGTKIKFGRYERTFEPFFNQYVVKEKFGRRNELKIQLNWASPVTMNGKRSALIMVNKTSLIETSA